MISPVATLALVATLQGPLPPNTPPKPQDPDALFLASKVEFDGHTLEYRLLTPQPMRAGERYPLILFLHGAGERGADNTKQLTHFPRRMATPERLAEFPCFVLAPQCASDDRWTLDPWGSTTSRPLDAQPTAPMQGAMLALQEVARTYPVDLDRIYLTGLSMGGYGAFQLALRHSDWFAAVAPVCGGGDERAAAALAGLPVSVWHGDQDGAVPVERSQQMVAALRALGETPDYHELHGVGHDAWNYAYADGGCLPWLFAQRRDPARRLEAAARLMADAFGEEERVAFLGDSITQAGATPGGYVDLLRTALAALKPKAVVIPAGVSGNKINDLLARYEKDIVAQAPTLVFIYIGINDVWHSQSGRGTPRDAFAPGLEALCQGLEAAPGTRCVVATASVIGERTRRPNELDPMLEDFVQMTRDVVASAASSPSPRTLCDLRRAFVDHLELFNVSDAEQGLLTRDKVHLSPAGNVYVATLAARALRAAALERVSTR
ncbi:MAG: GDSL-type esterase/lipase family protein [Planctomycetota bacterium]